MELLNLSFSTIIIVVFILVRIAFFTLLEQKVLSHIQIRKGPLYTGYIGLLQPFSDAVKLLAKENILTLNINKRFFIICPIIRLTLSLILWFSNPNFSSILIFNYRILWFFLISALAVIPILIIGWRSNCKYSILGRLRRVSQIVSYEAVITILLISVIFINKRIRFKELIIVVNIRFFLFGPFFIIWFCTILAETNRTPYDFSEGGSELVSGFITEYGSFGFTLVFMREYLNILYISILFSIILSSNNILITGFYIIVIGFIFIWIRASLPRFRYDKLISLVWKCLLPISIFLFYFILKLDIFSLLV